VKTTAICVGKFVRRCSLFGITQYLITFTVKPGWRGLKKNPALQLEVSQE
jgi:hypothetical protein